MGITVMFRFRMLGEPQIAVRKFDSTTEAIDAINLAPKLVYSMSACGDSNAEHAALFSGLARFGRWYREGKANSEEIRFTPIEGTDE